MKIDIRAPEPRGHGDYYTRTRGGYGNPHGEIWLDEAGSFRLDYLTEDDCDRLIRAAAEIKPRVAALRAEMAAPHGRRHLYKGTCQLCGKPEADGLHADPAAVLDDRPRLTGADVLLAAAELDAEMREPKTEDAQDGACGEAWPVDPALTCFREPGHCGQHAADPGDARQTRAWPNAATREAAGDHAPETEDAR